MRAKLKTTNSLANKQALRDKYCNWHRWFAWHPVAIGGGEYAWLETVERRAGMIGSTWLFDLAPVEYAYRLIDA